MKILLDKTGTVKAFQRDLELVASSKDVKSVLIFACDANGFAPTQVDPMLVNLSLPAFGGVFPQVIHDRERLEKGTVIVGLEHDMNVQVLQGLSDPDADYEEILDSMIPSFTGVNTMFVLVDGFSKRIGALLDGLFTCFGLEMNYIGGGAGSLSFEQKPCLFTNQGMLMDSAVLALSEMKTGVGVNHGWEDVSSVYKVTASKDNTIVALDWQPAFEVYRKVVEDHSGQTFADRDFFDIAKAYPFGIGKLGAEKVVRDPISVGEHGDLVCVGEVPQDSFVNILTGSQESLVNAAHQALELGKQAFSGGETPSATLLIDCISRVLFLDNDFDEEIAAVSEAGRPLIGALTLGEIANNGKEFLEFYNKTCVVGILE